ncbi:MAG: hypothetical protein QOF45_466 [Gaiellaceae bacterium]|nr:hypothetical protein [Gaiellaceae bacterium]
MLLLALSVCGCSGPDSAAPPTQSQKFEKARLTFVPASSELIASCRTTARAVGYPIPCPAKVPHRLTETRVNGPSGCALHIIGPAGMGGCPKSWRGWVVGSGETPTDHLVITASPQPLHNYGKVVNGPAWYPNALVKPLGWITVGHTRMRAVFVPQATNDGSAFANHVVLIWTVGQHTYGVGFHVVKDLRQTLLLDEELAKHIRFVRP